MRLALLILSATALGSSGCSPLIFSSGRQLEALKTQNEVHKAFGEPRSTTKQADGTTVEVFKTHRKIAEPQKGIYWVMGCVWTFGFGEFIWFPHEALVAVRRSIKGQEIRFTYDESGKSVAAFHDGREVFGPPRTESAQPTPELQLADRIAIGQPLPDAHALLLSDGAKDISDSVGIFAIAPTRHCWYELRDGTCLCVRADGDGVVRALELGETGLGYGDKIKWLGQRHREVQSVQFGSP